jgi:mannitol-1-/sugar-/sorbitol-6-/2-deoxyglucose-6-phosphatase
MTSRVARVSELLAGSDAVIFDMDGLLIDSEPTWRRSEIEVFAEVGVTLTEAMCRETTGLRIDEVVAHHYGRAPWEGTSVPALAARIVDRMIEEVTARGAPLPGAVEAIERLSARGVPLGLASSSPRRLIDATLARLSVAARFAAITSAEDDRYGKPHPSVYLRAAEALGAAPTRCLVFEDSLNGVIAAKAARMRCVAVPESDPAPGFAVADALLGSLRDLEV